MTPFPSDHQRNANSLACRNMDRASVSEPEVSNTDDNQRTSTCDSKDRAESYSSQENKAASSKASFASLGARPERSEHEHTPVSEARFRAGVPSSHGNTANSTEASFTSLRTRPERDGHERTSAGEANYRAGVSSSHGKTANSMKASSASLRRPQYNAHEPDDRSEGGDSQPDP